MYTLVHLYISYANLFLCFYNMIWDIIFRTTFKVIWYRAWSNWARTHYIWIDCWYLARVLWDPGTLYSARTTIQGVDWCSACSVPTLVTTRAWTRIQFSLSCKNCNSPQRSVNQTNLSWTLFWVFSLLWWCLETLFWTIRTATLSCQLEDTGLKNVSYEKARLSDFAVRVCGKIVDELVFKALF